ncbi:Hypothetical predicted protein [Cloeon dipterum]|uniref:Transmembrane protein n=1 Tax=Cloeon dipterum TaxID=197152 RepID=A0A8S1DL44_9INSE|nr:Hypothetical predicted protein [Cloeon dipterum]
MKKPVRGRGGQSTSTIVTASTSYTTAAKNSQAEASTPSEKKPDLYDDEEEYQGFERLHDRHRVLERAVRRRKSKIMHGLMIVKGFMTMSIVVWYSAGVWRLLNGYFNNAYKDHLEQKMREHEILRRNVLQAQPPPPPLPLEDLQKLRPRIEGSRSAFLDAEDEDVCPVQPPQDSGGCGGPPSATTEPLPP